MNNVIEIKPPEPTAEYTGEWVTCSCCGKDVHDTPEANRDFETRGSDTGYGHCVECFGEPPKPDAKPTGELPSSEAACKRRLGWAGRMFYNTRIGQLEKALTGTAQEKFKAMPYPKKIIVIGKMVERGYMI